MRLDPSELNSRHKDVRLELDDSQKDIFDKPSDVLGREDCFVWQHSFANSNADW